MCIYIGRKEITRRELIKLKMSTFTETLVLHNHTTKKEEELRRACFSFAAYSKKLINRLKTTNNPKITIHQGLTDLEFSYIESSLNFTFPPDLRSILREGLPLGPGFPNWRSSSHQHLQILTTLPKLAICREISTTKLWFPSWGTRPSNNNEALDLAKDRLKYVPDLVPIYKNFYVPSTPNLAGNPVFYASGSDVKVWSFDLTGFFEKTGFPPGQNSTPSHQVNNHVQRVETSGNVGPAWAATAARRIEFWSEMAESGAGWVTRGWWSRGDELGVCMEEVYWRLRDGGWREEEANEMMMVNEMDGGDCWKFETIKRDLMSLLISGGWSRDDVVYSLGSDYCHQCDGQ